MRSKSKTSGFSLLELMIALGIISILSMVIYPSYVDYIVKADRTEAMRELVRIANLQEQYIIDNKTYTLDATVQGDSPATALSESGNFLLAVAAGNTGSIATSFLLEATAQGDHSMRDTDCAYFSLSSIGARTAQNSTGATNTDCWFLR